MSAVATSYGCDPWASPQVDIEADVAVAKIPAISLTMENLAFRIRMYKDDNATSGCDVSRAFRSGCNATEAEAASPTPAGVAGHARGGMRLGAGNVTSKGSNVTSYRQRGERRVDNRVETQFEAGPSRNRAKH